MCVVVVVGGGGIVCVHACVYVCACVCVRGCVCARVYACAHGPEFTAFQRRCVCGVSLIWARRERGVSTLLTCSSGWSVEEAASALQVPGGDQRDDVLPVAAAAGGVGSGGRGPARDEVGRRDAGAAAPLLLGLDEREEELLGGVGRDAVLPREPLVGDGL